MNYGGVTTDVVEDLLVLEDRIKASKILISKLDETIRIGDRRNRSVRR